MTGYLALLLVFSALMSGQPVFIVKGVLLVLFYSIFDSGWAYLKYKTWYWPVSSWISALILGVVAWPDLPWYFTVLLPLLAVISKQFLHFGKARHIFNPAGFALGVCSFFVPAVAWWGASWGNLPLLIMGAAGIFILWRQSRWHEFIAFALSYLFFLYLLAASIGTMFWQGSTLFFASIMLIEPITSQFPSKNQRVAYGALVGFFAVLALFLLNKWPLFSADPLILGLLLGNVTASLIFLPHAQKK